MNTEVEENSLDPSAILGGLNDMLDGKCDSIQIGVSFSIESRFEPIEAYFEELVRGVDALCKAMGGHGVRVAEERKETNGARRRIAVVLELKA